MCVCLLLAALPLNEARKRKVKSLESYLLISFPSKLDGLVFEWENSPREDREGGRLGNEPHEAAVDVFGHTPMRDYRQTVVLGKRCPPHTCIVRLNWPLAVRKNAARIDWRDGGLGARSGGGVRIGERWAGWRY
jgi:hypothetical protein